MEVGSRSIDEEELETVGLQNSTNALKGESWGWDMPVLKTMVDMTAHDQPF